MKIAIPWPAWEAVRKTDSALYRLDMCAALIGHPLAGTFPMRLRPRRLDFREGPRKPALGEIRAFTPFVLKTWQPGVNAVIHGGSHHGPSGVEPTVTRAIIKKRLDGFSADGSSCWARLELPMHLVALGEWRALLDGVTYIPIQSVPREVAT